MDRNSVLETFIHQMVELVERESTQTALIEGTHQNMRFLLGVPNLFPTHYNDTATLYHDPKDRFIFQVFSWAPGSRTPIHDHNTWGVMGIYQGVLEVSEYQVSSFYTPQKVLLRRTNSFASAKGDLVWLSYPDAEIHQLFTPSPSQSTLSLHVYGGTPKGTHHFYVERYYTGAECLATIKPSS